MMKKYDEVVKMPADKLAQVMSDFTYCYKETKVPKLHYKKILEETIEEEMNEIMTSKLLDVYVKTIKSIIEDSPKMYIKALMCIDKKINPINIRPNELQGLNEVANEYVDNAKEYKGVVNEKLLALYDNVIANGLLVKDDSQQIVVGNHNVFCFLTKEDLQNVELKKTNILVKYEHKVYPVYDLETLDDILIISDLINESEMLRTQEFKI